MIWISKYQISISIYRFTNLIIVLKMIVKKRKDLDPRTGCITSEKSVITSNKHGYIMLNPSLKSNITFFSHFLCILFTKKVNGIRQQA